jgi:hypothetical protein
MDLPRMSGFLLASEALLIKVAVLTLGALGFSAKLKVSTHGYQ